MELITSLAIGMLFAVSIFLILRRNVVRSALGLLLFSYAINLFLLSVGAYAGTEPAYTYAAAGQRSDALPQALILTAIVISMGGLAFVLALLNVISARYRTSDQDEIDWLKN